MARLVLILIDTADALPGLERAAFSAVLTSDVPITAERAMYFVMPRGY